MSSGLIIFGAKYLIILPPVLLVWYFLAARRRAKRKLLLLTIISLPITYLVGRIAGHFYYNVRPFIESGVAPLVAHANTNGFPSDHTLFAATFAMLALYFSRPLGIFLWIVAVLIGLSRVAAGVHHYVDIVAGAIIASVCVYVVHTLIKNKHWYQG